MVVNFARRTARFMKRHCCQTFECINQFRLMGAHNREVSSETIHSSDSILSPETLRLVISIAGTASIKTVKRIAFQFKSLNNWQVRECPD